MSSTDKVVEVRGDYRILEREILGNKYYCLAKVYNILGFKFTRKIKTAERMTEYGAVGVRTWQSTQNFIQRVIDNIEYEKKKQCFGEIAKMNYPQTHLQKVQDC